MPSEEELSLVLPQDIEKAFSGPEEKPVALPIDENLLQESLDELFQLVGLEPIKKSVRELAQLAQFYREVNKDVAEELEDNDRVQLVGRHYLRVSDISMRINFYFISKRSWNARRGTRSR